MLRAQLTLGHSCPCSMVILLKSGRAKPSNMEMRTLLGKGCCLTAKEQELWEPWGAVSSEDVLHMKNRMRVFTCTAVLRHLRHTVCLCKWIREKATESDGRTSPNNVFGVAA